MKKNRVIIITGGCQGLGYDIAKKLAENAGNNVVIISHKLEALQKAAEELKTNYYLCDVSDYVQVEKAAEDIAKEYGAIDVLINNAGVLIEGELDSYDSERIKNVIDVNALGVMYFSKAVLPAMKKQKSGIILNINSVSGINARANRSVYNASKWAVTGFSESLRKEVAQYGIAVLSLFPGLMRTNLFKNAAVERDMSHSLDPKDVARTVEFMISFDDPTVLLSQVVMRHLDYEF